MKLLRKILFVTYYNLFLKKKLCRTHNERIGEFTFTIYPTVFSPKEFISSEIFAAFINGLDLNNKNVLDMGCGSGIVSIFAASGGAACTAADINPIAVKAASENAVTNGLTGKIKVIESDLFNNPVLKRDNYDIIFFNPPYYRGTPENNFEAAFKGGEDFDVIRRFLSESKNYLRKDGYICVIISSDMGLNTFEEIVYSNDLNFEIAAKINKFFETFYIIKIVI